MSNSGTEPSSQALAAPEGCLQPLQQELRGSRAVPGQRQDRRKGDWHSAGPQDCLSPLGHRSEGSSVRGNGRLTQACAWPATHTRHRAVQKSRSETGGQRGGHRLSRAGGVGVSTLGTGGSGHVPHEEWQGHSKTS